MSEAPNEDTPFGSEHEYLGERDLRNGWVELRYDYGHVAFEYEPGHPETAVQPKLTARHALRSVTLLRFGYLTHHSGRR